MAKKGGKAGNFGKAHGGGSNMKSKLVESPMAQKMAIKGGKVSGKKGY